MNTKEINYEVLILNIQRYTQTGSVCSKQDYLTLNIDRQLKGERQELKYTDDNKWWQVTVMMMMIIRCRWRWLNRPGKTGLNQNQQKTGENDNRNTENTKTELKTITVFTTHSIRYNILRLFNFMLSRVLEVKKVNLFIYFVVANITSKYIAGNRTPSKWLTWSTSTSVFLLFCNYFGYKEKQKLVLATA